MRRLALAFAASLAAAPLWADPAATLVGHGGPVMDIDVRADRVLTASFDYAAGLWRLSDPETPVWLDGHRAAVNAVAFLDDARALSGGDDFDAILWDLDRAQPIRRFTGHKGKVVAVAPSPDGARLATASWDGTARIWDMATGAVLATLDAHRGPVNDIAWGQGALFTASQDGRILEWDPADWSLVRVVAEHGFGINVLALDEAAGWLAFGALDGGTRVLALSDLAPLADLTADRRPVLALALSPDGARLAVGDGEGYLMVVATADWSVERDIRAALNGPVWALAFADGDTVISGGISDAATIWPLGSDVARPDTAETARAFQADPATLGNGERQFQRKCSVCHTLTGDTARRAGPSLENVFGRRAGTYPGYAYSDALAGSDIVWTAETVARLFEIGPDHMTPGSKMPMQQIASAQDRADLIEFLEIATRPE
ncbi:c-type cytochrome [Palleronia sediminis]|uniref:C-type cytochrome n=1 Tax=Palleronia sediminis TaxID=2547833 RepID=A0A4V3B9J7_9RHOB|nr:c-type cytochrome [Palleronia sediminis]TDL79519.1 c-type cytochrome [Palleronia sediminis]